MLSIPRRYPRCIQSSPAAALAYSPHITQAHRNLSATTCSAPRPKHPRSLPSFIHNDCLPTTISPVPSTPASLLSLTTRPARRTTVKFDELPSAPSIPPPPPIPPDPIPYPPLIQSVVNIQEQYPQALVCTRVGHFYESHFQQAVDISALTGLKLTARRTVRGPVSLVGFPTQQLGRYLRLLVRDMGKNVVVVEEFQTATGIERRVARIVTPGTYMEDDNGEVELGWRNWIMAVVEGAVCWADVGTGDVFVRGVKAGMERAEVERVGPSEVLLGKGVEGELKGVMEELGSRAGWRVKTMEEDPPESAWDELIGGMAAQGPAVELTPNERTAASLLFGYLNENFQVVKPLLQLPKRWEVKEKLQLDATALRALEITKTSRDGNFKGSLMHAIKSTCTAGGRRLLQDWFTAPLTDPAEMEKRLDIVERLVDQPSLRYSLSNQLKQCADLPRTVQKLAMGRADADDLIAIRRTIEFSAVIVDNLKHSKKVNTALEELYSGLKGPKKVAEIIEKSIDEEGVVKKHVIEEEEAMKNMVDEEEIVEMSTVAKAEGAGAAETEAEGPTEETWEEREHRKMLKKARDDLTKERELDIWIIKRGASRALASLHKQLDQLFQQKEEMIIDLRNKLGVKSLMLRWTPALSHHIQLKNKDVSADITSLGEHRVMSSARSSKTIHYPQWSYLGAQLDSTRVSIRAAEQVEFQKIRLMVLKHIRELRILGEGLSKLDVLLSFASVADNHGWARPSFTTDLSTKLVGATHPCLPDSLTPVPNDIELSPASSHTAVITGPNTSGKSTFLKAVGLCTILAQCGSFVPAASMVHSPVDAIFTRINSTDNLQTSLSRYTSELSEVNNILKYATRSSLILLDEPITSTDPPSALALTYSILEELHSRMQISRVILATHLLPLYDLLKDTKGVEWLRTGIWEKEGRWGFRRELEKGVADESEALRVAGASGLPVGVLQRAQRVQVTGWGAKKGVVNEDEIPLLERRTQGALEDVPWDLSTLEEKPISLEEEAEPVSEPAKVASNPQGSISLDDALEESGKVTPWWKTERDSLSELKSTNPTVEKSVSPPSRPLHETMSSDALPSPPPGSVALRRNLGRIEVFHDTISPRTKDLPHWEQELERMRYASTSGMYRRFTKKLTKELRKSQQLPFTAFSSGWIIVEEELLEKWVKEVKEGVDKTEKDDLPDNFIALVEETEEGGAQVSIAEEESEQGKQEELEEPDEPERAGKVEPQTYRLIEELARYHVDQARRPRVRTRVSRKRQSATDDEGQLAPGLTRKNANKDEVMSNLASALAMDALSYKQKLSADEAPEPAKVSRKQLVKEQKAKAEEASAIADGIQTRAGRVLDFESFFTHKTPLVKPVINLVKDEERREEEKKARKKLFGRGGKGDEEG